MPPEVESFANLSNTGTWRAHETAVKDFMRFTAIVRPEPFRTVTRGHITARRENPMLRGAAILARPRRA